MGYRRAAQEREGRARARGSLPLLKHGDGSADGVMLARLELYSEAWRERRWEKPVTSWDDNSRKHGEAMFDAIRGRGRVPSFVEVSFQSSSTELWDWDLEWELTYT